MTTNAMRKWEPDDWLNIPQELRDRAQWMVAGADKVPQSVKYGRNADLRMPISWATFDEAYKYAYENRMNIGFVFTAGAELTCIDVDNKAERGSDLYNENQQRMHAMYRHFDTYIEQSMSGNGLHIVMRGEIGQGVRVGNIEAYSQERFIIMTGDVQKDRPLLRDDELLSSMVADLRGRQRVDKAALDDVDATESNEALCERIMASKSGEKFRKLVAPDWASYINENTGRPFGDDPSGADIAFATLVGFFTKSNRQICEIYNFTPLRHRLKDGKPRHPTLDNFLKHTVAKARGFLINDASNVIDFKTALDKALADKLAAAQVSEPIGAAPSESQAPLNLPPMTNMVPRFTTKRAKEVLQEPAIEWAVQDLFQSHAINAIYGWSGVGKSFIALDMAAAVADGIEWFGYKTLKMPVTYVAIEGGNALNQRIAAFEKGNGHEYPHNVEFYRGAFKLTDVECMSDFIASRRMAGWTGGMIVIDTFAKAILGSDENSATDMGKVVEALETLKEKLNACVVIVHHSTKPDAKTGIAGSMRGSGSLQAGIEGVFEVAKQPIFDEEDKDKVVAYRRFVRTNKVKEGDDRGFHYFELPKIMLDRYDNFGTQLSSCCVEPEHRGGEVNSNIAPKATSNVPTYSAAEYARGSNAPATRPPRSKRETDEQKVKKYDVALFIDRAMMLDADRVKNSNKGKWGAPAERNATPRDALATILTDLINPDDVDAAFKTAIRNAINYAVTSGKLGRNTIEGKAYYWLV